MPPRECTNSAVSLIAKRFNRVPLTHLELDEIRYAGTEEVGPQNSSSGKIQFIPSYSTTRFYGACDRYYHASFIATFTSRNACVFQPKAIRYSGRSFSAELLPSDWSTALLRVALGRSSFGEYPEEASLQISEDTVIVLRGWPSVARG